MYHGPAISRDRGCIGPCFIRTAATPPGRSSSVTAAGRRAESRSGEVDGGAAVATEARDGRKCAKGRIENGDCYFRSPDAISEQRNASEACAFTPTSCGQAARRVSIAWRGTFRRTWTIRPRNWTSERLKQAAERVLQVHGIVRVIGADTVRLNPWPLSREERETVESRCKDLIEHVR